MTTEVNTKNEDSNILLLNSMNMDLLKVHFGFMISHRIRSHSTRLKGLLTVYETGKGADEKEKIPGLMVDAVLGLEEELSRINQQLDL